RAAGPAFRQPGLAAPAGCSWRWRGGADRRGLRRVAGGGTEGGIAMSTGRLTGLVAEDEAPQRRALVEQLRAAWPELELVAVCEDGEAALDAVEEHRPAVAFLDIRMPGASGMDVARAVAAHGGMVVFTTAYDDYSVRAFEAGAADYLLKPVQPERLRQAIERLRQRLAERNGSPAADLQSLLEGLEARMRRRGGQLIRWIAASVSDGVHVICNEVVLFYHGQNKCVRVATADGDAVVRAPLKELVMGLVSESFCQVHRGA